MQLNKKTFIPNLQHPNTRYALAFLAGAVMLFAYAPFQQGWLAPLAIAAWLLLLVRSQTPRQAAFTGFAFGMGWFGTGVSWVFVSIDTFGGLPMVASLLLMLLFFSYLALYPALASWLWLKARLRLNGYGLFAFPFIWLFTELIRGWAFTGFPWLGIGYTQSNTLFASFAPHIGEIGLTLVVFIIAISFAYVALSKRLEWFIAPVLLYALAAFSSSINPMQVTGETSKVALVQGNIKQELKWDKAQEWPNFLHYKTLTEPLLGEYDLVVWPESAITFIEPTAQAALTAFAQQAGHAGTNVISGIIDYHPDSQQFYNSIVVLGDAQQPYYWQNKNRYSKHKLLPIGEFVPFESLLRPIAPLFNLPMSSFSRGMPTQENLVSDSLQIAANVCYEVAFSGYIRRQLQEHTQLLLTVSNDTWFGASHGPHQHFEVARMRAREFGRPLLRATNNGITAVIDHQGYVIKQLPQFSTGVAAAYVPLVEGTTWYTRWGASSAWLLALLFFGFSCLRRNQLKE
ncbi:apolipoprotein N-acyltransferase [Aliidiomarina taiwanensis]|uniref:Apolipoprotein N-acyltransferase n=1 Tax=Aliidiomarina taiwanensis TaxID=946228 RepID=A0A432X955_9GAMM|nr:apolipoprotein N-acyltransferase [Aliidiomarina taiwanensis]RUO43889.1 apolipoprotein N-acyltransferase [Aliidiomarina taiwanensis]